MLPKRKFIRKLHRRPEEEPSNNSQPGTLLERLRSTDSSLVEEALAYINSMCSLPDNSEQLPILAELVTLLRRSGTAGIYQSLYALANLVDIEPTIVPKLFQLGLAEALRLLNSGDAQLLKPILSLMTSLHGLIPAQHEYLESGVQNALTTDHLSQSCREEVLSFLVRLGSGKLREQMYGKVYQLFTNQSSLRLRSLCASVLISNLAVQEKVSKELLDYCEELLCDIDLQKEYDNNILKGRTEKTKEVETDMIEQEEEVEQLEHPNYQTFNDAVEGVEGLLEALLQVIQDSQEESLEQEEIEQEMEGQELIGEIEVEQPKQYYPFLAFVSTRWEAICRNTQLSFPEGQNIVHLSLRVLFYVKNAPQEVVSRAVLTAFAGSLQAGGHDEARREIILVGLHLLLKGQVPEEGRETLLVMGEAVLQVSKPYRECWLCLLELYSRLFNPEKGAVSLLENRRVGLILRNLILNVPQLSLQQWRGQAIDTVFDVFSNQSFDECLLELGLLGVLEKVGQQAGTGKKRRFVREVLADIQRFLAYKRKMIGF